MASVGNIDERRAFWQQAAKGMLDGKRQRISISIPERDLARLKTRAAEEGMKLKMVRAQRAIGAPVPSDTGAAARERVWLGIREFMSMLDTVPGWQEWRRKKISYTMNFDDLYPDPARNEIEKEFSFPESIEKQHAVIMGFLALADSVGSLKECEYYFRRYPFRGLPVARYRHIVNVCEMYFGRFYEIRERVRNVLNAVNVLVAPHKLDVGKFLKTFDKAFDQEIRARHGIHHRERFDDVAINRIFLAETLASSDAENSSLFRANLGEYRRLASEWAKRVHERGKLMDKFLEVVAEAVVQNCDFCGAKIQRQDSAVSKRPKNRRGRYRT